MSNETLGYFVIANRNNRKGHVMQKSFLAILVTALFALGGCGSENQLTAEDVAEGGATEPVAKTSQAIVGHPQRFQAYGSMVGAGQTYHAPSTFRPPGSTLGGTIGICAIDQIIGGFKGGGDDVKIVVNSSGFLELDVTNDATVTGQPSAEMVCAPGTDFTNFNFTYTPYNLSADTGYCPDAPTYPYPLGCTENASPDTLAGKATFAASNLTWLTEVGGYFGEDYNYLAAGAFAQVRTNPSSGSLGGQSVVNAAHVANTYQPVGGPPPPQSELKKTSTRASLWSFPKTNGWVYAKSGTSQSLFAPNCPPAQDFIASNSGTTTLTATALVADLSSNFCFLTGIGRDFQDSSHAAKIQPNGSGAAVGAYGLNTQASASCIPYGQP